MASGATSDQPGRVWLRYEPPALIQERENVKAAYDLRAVELDLTVGRVEHYWAQGEVLRWRSLDCGHNDWRAGFTTREACAQDLVTQCPRVLQRMEWRRARRGLPAGPSPR